jgi:hypothetical protein
VFVDSVGGLGLYVFGSGARISNNTLINIPQWPNTGGVGIYVHENAQGPITLENNIIVGYNYGISSDQTGGAPVIARNNLIVSNNPNREIYEGSNSVVRITRANNLLGLNIPALDPKLVNPAAGDFRLQAGSPAIDKGYPNGLTTDKDGNARPRGNGVDIGAYEFGN